MSLREDQLSDANAVFDEWTTKYPFLKTFTRQAYRGPYRQLT
jgi:hypothetical protein